MNTNYLLIEGIIFLFLVYTFIKSEDWWEYRASDGKQFLSFVSLLVSVILLVVSFIPGTGETNYTIKDANSQKMLHQIIAQVEGWPTQITENIKFIDAPLQIKRSEPRNAWGIDCTSAHSYEIQIRNPLIKTELQ